MKKNNELNDRYYASSLTKQELKEIQKSFPKLFKKRKTIKEYISSIKNYDYIVAELYCTRNKLLIERENIKMLSNKETELEQISSNRLQKIFSLMKNNEELEKILSLKSKDLENVIKKFKETEKRRRINSGKVGGLVKQNNILIKKNEMYTQIIEAKDRDLKQAAIIIDNLNKKIKSLKNKPTIEELKQYEMTRKSPRKNR